MGEGAGVLPELNCGRLGWGFGREKVEFVGALVPLRVGRVLVGRDRGTEGLDDVGG